jgi:hypothetical protein
MNIKKPNLRINGKLQWGNKPNKIVLHHPEWKGTPEDLNEMMINMGFVMCGYNYYVRKDGSVYEMRPIAAIGGNCYGHNTCSIGVSFEGNFMIDIMSEVQKQAGIELCKYLMQKDANIKEIGPHSKYCNTACPGTNFPIKEVIDSVFGSVVPSKIVGIDTHVLLLQKSLNKLKIRDSKGNHLSEDGKTGTCTKEAVKRFQSIVGLTIDGFPGANTWEALNRILARPLSSIRHQPAPEVIKYIQWIVKITADGAWGPLTDVAVKRFQGSNGLSADGWLGEQSWSKLLS